MSTVWRVMYPDGSRCVFGSRSLAVASARGDESRVETIQLDLHPGPLKRELAVLRGMAATRGDDDAVLDAEIDAARLQHIEDAALLALGMLWMSGRESDLVHAAYTTLRNALGGRPALQRAIEAAHGIQAPR